MLEPPPPLPLVESPEHAPKPGAARVLVVDDSQSSRRIVARLLQILGHGVAEAEDGVVALERVAAEPYDLMILDMSMPRMGGVEVLERLKATGVLPHLPVIVISGEDEMETILRCIEIGAEDYLPKPFPPRLLRARLEACLEKKRLRDRERELYDAVVASQKQLSQELSQAAAYVRSLLPAPIPAGDIRAEWEFLPCSRLGGDGLGYGWLDPNHFAFYLLDVCGHGMGAALLSISAMHVLRARSLPGVDFRSPAEVVGALNESFPMEAHNNLYFTLWYGVFDPRRRELRFVSGGHPPAALIEPRGVRTLRTRGPAVGCLPGVRYAADACEVAPGSRLYLFSDGAYEIARPDGATLQIDDLLAQITAPHAPPRLPAIVEAMRRQGASPHLEDDVSLLEVTFD